MPLMVAARHGHLPVVQLLLAQGVVVDAKNRAGKTALHLAAWKGHPEVVSFLLEAGAKWSTADRHGRNALMTAAMRGDVDKVRLLLSYAVKDEPGLIDKADDSEYTALGYALREGHADVCEVLVMEGGADCRDMATLGPEMSFWELAVEEGHQECVKLLEGWAEMVDDVVAAVKEGAELERIEMLLSKAPQGAVFETFEDDSLLTMAVEASRVDVVRLLLERGYCSGKNRGGIWSARFQAVRAGQAEMVSVLLEGAAAHCDPDPRLVGYAAERGHVEVVRRLLQEERTDVNAQNDRMQTPLWLAAAHGHVEIVKVLLQAGADTTLPDRKRLSSMEVAKEEEIKEAIREVEEQIRQLSEACSSGRVEEVATMLASHPQLVNGRRADQRRQTVLMMAAEAGQREVARPLLEKGADAKLMDDEKQTALMLAAGQGHAEVVALLLSGAGGSQMDLRDQTKRSALLRACEAGDVEVAKLLLQRGAKHQFLETKQGAWYQTIREEEQFPLVVASKAGNVELVKVLLQRSWDQRARDDSLREASEGMHTEVVKALVERLGSVSEKVFERALQVAVTRGSMALLTALLTNVTSDLAVLRQCLSTVVTPACRFGQGEILQVLVDLGASPELSDLQRFAQRLGVPVNSLKHMGLLVARERFVEAMREGDLQAASRLVEEYGRQALVNTGALEAAIQAGREESVRWLLENGAWLSDLEHPWVEPTDQRARLLLLRETQHALMPHKPQPGLAELALACHHGHLGIVKYLIEKGADPWQGRAGRRSPLAMAARNGHLSVMRHLLHIGAAQAELRYQLKAALMTACKHGHVEVGVELVAGANPRDGYRVARDTSQTAGALLLLRARAQREYLLAKACCIHAAATVVPPCLAARAAEGLVPLPSVELLMLAKAEGGGERGEAVKTERVAIDRSLEVVCEVARFVVEQLKGDLHMELMEMLMPGEKTAKQLLQRSRGGLLLGDHEASWLLVAQTMETASVRPIRTQTPTTKATDLKDA